MRRFLLLSMLCCLCLRLNAQESEVPPVAVPRPAPARVMPVGDGGLEFYFTSITQGTIGILRLTGTGATEAQASLNNTVFPFFHPQNEDDLYALIVAPIDAQPRTYTLEVLIALADGSLQTVQTDVQVTDAGYIRQVFSVPNDRAYLINPEVERNEFARIDALTTTINPVRLWDAGGFQLPIVSEIVSGFGQYRVLNNTVQTRHTGWDQKAAPGTPVYAMAAGVVVYANQLDIRGNYVLLDHGWGIYSGYAHFSQIAVTPGQSIARGELIGLSGNAGRTSGPHLHWEINVSGEWIDGNTLIGAWLP